MSKQISPRPLLSLSFVAQLSSRKMPAERIFAMVFPEARTLVLLHHLSTMTADYFEDMGLQGSKVVIG